MKKIIVPVVLLVLITTLSVSCKKIISNIFNGFDAEVPAISVTIPPIQPPFPGFPVPDNEIPVGSFKQKFDLDSTIKANTAGAFGAGDVNSIKIKKVTFSLKDADQNNNLSNFESVRINFSSTSNQNAVQIASFTFPNTYTISETIVSDANTPELIDYLKGNELTYNVFGKLRRYTTKPLKLSVNVTLSIK